MSAARLASKAIVFSCQATEGHMQVKIKSMLKFLKQGKHVSLRITGSEDRSKAMESVYQSLYKTLGSGAKFNNKHVGSHCITVTLIPGPQISEIKLEDSRDQGKDDDLSLDNDQDLLSDEFEQKLEQSIRDERKKGAR